MLPIRFALLFSVSLLGGCATRHPDPASFYMTEDTVYFVDSQGPQSTTFNSAIDKTFSGDDESLTYILSLSPFTDGEGSLHFGETLLDLRNSVGINRFNKSYSSLSPMERVAIDSDMKTARDMRTFMKKHNAG